ncbi:hypothetical protein Tco_0388790 [Tanacetum coccineum]
MPTEMELTLEQTQQGVSYEVSMNSSQEMEILLEATSNKLMVDFRYSDTTHLSRSVKVLKLKNFKKDATLKLFKNGMSMSVQKSQVHKMAKFQDGKEIKINLLIAKIEALKDNPTPSSNFMTKSPFTSPNSFLEETNISYNSLPESETFCFNLEEKSSGNPTSYTDLSLPDYEAFFCDSEPDSGDFTMDSFVIKSPIPVEDGDSFLEKFETTPELETFKFDIEEKNSGSTTIHADISLPDLECVYFKSEPDPGDLTSIDPGIRENVSSTTNVNLPFEDDQSPLFAYVVWIFLSFLTYPVAPPYLLSSGNEDTIFDPGISIYHSFMPGVSHRSGTFMKFNDCPDFEASRARGFVLRSLELQILSFIMGIQYPNLID